MLPEDMKAILGGILFLFLFSILFVTQKVRANQELFPTVSISKSNAQ
jgi:hypothetical protein